MDEVDTTPRFQSRSFACPHCGAISQQAWAECTAKDTASGDLFEPNIFVSTCFVCERNAIWRAYIVPGGYGMRSAGIIWPITQRSGPARSGDMPAEVAALYDEAAAVVRISPRSAAALLRLALEALLEDLYPDKSGNLNAMIGAAVTDGLPERVQRTMDFMRFSGNQSVHEVHNDDTPETAATLFNLLNIVVERLVTQPKQLDALYEALPQTFKQQVERRDGRTA